MTSGERSTEKAQNRPSDDEVLTLMRLLAPVVEHRRHHGIRAEDAEVYARTVLDAGYRLTPPDQDGAS